MYIKLGLHFCFYKGYLQQGHHNDAFVFEEEQNREGY
jgi:hypothetical protein